MTEERFDYDFGSVLGGRPVVDEFRDELEAIYKLHAAKRSDYTADSADRLANYRFSGKAIGVSVEAAMFMRLSEKYFRAMNVFNRGGQVAVTEEKLEDTLRDLCIISLLIHLSLKGGEYGDPEART